MGQPVVHFEVVGKDGARLQSYYSELFGWKIDAGNPMGYGIVEREDNLSPQGIGIGGGVSGPLPAPTATSRSMSRSPTSRLRSHGPRPWAESGSGARTKCRGPRSSSATFADPEGHLIGLTKSWS